MNDMFYAEVLDRDFLFNRRHELELSLRDIAGRANCSHAFVRQLESGVKKRLSPELALRLLGALEVPQSAWLLVFRFHGFSARFQHAAA